LVRLGFSLTKSDCVPFFTSTLPPGTHTGGEKKKMNKIEESGRKERKKKMNKNEESGRKEKRKR
jgi:hypothetical protein